MNTCTLKSDKDGTKKFEFVRHDKVSVLIKDESNRTHKTISPEEFEDKYKILSEDEPKG